MTPQDEIRVAVAVQETAALMHHVIDSPTTKAFIRALRDLEPAAIIDALQTAQATLKWFPKPAEIRDIATPPPENKMIFQIERFRDSEEKPVRCVACRDFGQVPCWTRTAIRNRNAEGFEWSGVQNRIHLQCSCPVGRKRADKNSPLVMFDHGKHVRVCHDDPRRSLYKHDDFWTAPNAHGCLSPSAKQEQGSAFDPNDYSYFE